MYPQKITPHKNIENFGPTNPKAKKIIDTFNQHLLSSTYTIQEDYFFKNASLGFWIKGSDGIKIIESKKIKIEPITDEHVLRNFEKCLKNGKHTIVNNFLSNNLRLENIIKNFSKNNPQGEIRELLESILLFSLKLVNCQHYNIISWYQNIELLQSIEKKNNNSSASKGVNTITNKTLLTNYIKNFRREEKSEVCPQNVSIKKLEEQPAVTTSTNNNNSNFDNSNLHDHKSSLVCRESLEKENDPNASFNDKENKNEQDPNKTASAINSESSDYSANEDDSLPKKECSLNTNVSMPDVNQNTELFGLANPNTKKIIDEFNKLLHIPNSSKQKQEDYYFQHAALRYYLKGDSGEKQISNNTITIEAIDDYKILENTLEILRRSRVGIIKDFLRDKKIQKTIKSLNNSSDKDTQNILKEILVIAMKKVNCSEYPIIGWYTNNIKLLQRVDKEFDPSTKKFTIDNQALLKERLQKLEKNSHTHHVRQKNESLMANNHSVTQTFCNNNATSNNDQLIVSKVEKSEEPRSMMQNAQGKSTSSSASTVQSLLSLTSNRNQTRHEVGGIKRMLTSEDPTSRTKLKYTNNLEANPSSTDYFSSSPKKENSGQQNRGPSFFGESHYQPGYELSAAETNTNSNFPSIKDTLELTVRSENEIYESQFSLELADSMDTHRYDDFYNHTY